MARSSTELKDLVDYLHLWYESYQKLIRFIGAVAVGVLFFTTTFLLKDVVGGAYHEKLKAMDLGNIRLSIILFAVCLFFVFLNLLVTYNWFVSGVNQAIKKSGLEFGDLGEHFKYRNRMGRMSWWGNISLLSGYLAGISLVAGMIFYLVGAWQILQIMLQAD